MNILLESERNSATGVRTRLLRFHSPSLKPLHHEDTPPYFLDTLLHVKGYLGPQFIYLVLTYMLYICMFPACCFRQRTCVAQGRFNGIPNET